MAYPTTPTEAPKYAIHRKGIAALDASLPDDDRGAMNLAGYETACVQVVPSGGANPTVKVFFWSDPADAWISEVPALTATAPGADTPFEFRVPVCGRRMFVAVTAGAVGSIDIYIAAFGPR